PAAEAPRVSAHLEWVPSGEFYIVKIPVQNDDEYLITDTRVALRIPDGLEIIDPKGRDMIRLGTIEPGKFGTATFRLTPERCVYGTVRGHITSVDARNRSQIIDLEEREVSGVCPLLTSEGADVKEIIERLEEGELMNTNQESLNFKGDPRAVYTVLLNCIGRLKCVENDPKTIGDTFIGRSLCVGKAPGTMEAQVKPDIVVETNVTGILSRNRGTLTLVAHSDSGAILTPFFVDIMRNVRQHVEVIGTGEKLELLVQKCPNCGTPIDLTQKTEDGIVHCESCRYPIRLPKYGLTDLEPEPTPPPAQANVCSQCGHENEPIAKFCVKCGNRP
ncbi:MAG: zinc ribbon domain-containing protein, partial [Candidatus Bathyarchaeia archaeon]